MNQPIYDLGEFQRLVKLNCYLVRDSANKGATSLGFDSNDIRRCVLGLSAADFDKTMAAEKLPGTFQDVYWPTYKGVRLYVKLQMTPGAVVISFKLNDKQGNK
ncbi:MAG: type II toxin-antitoxin system MqsR family toxin [Rectinemataceae bacterium]